MPLAKLNPKPKSKQLASTPRVMRFTALGTQWEIRSEQTLSLLDWQALKERIQERLETYDADYSRFRADSLVTQMANSAGTYTLPADARALFDLYSELYKYTNGQMTPLIGQLLADAGYDADYSLVPKTLSTPPQWEDVLDYHFPTLVMKQPALLDVGAAGKGYAVDIIAEIMEASGVSGYCINAGGDILNHDVSDVLSRIGLEHPKRPDQVIGVATIASGSLCGSAGNRRAWGEFHHIMDPSQKRSVENVLATWVVADTALLADGLATALFFSDPAVLLQHYSFSFAIIHADLSLSHSADFPAEFFTSNQKQKD